MSNDDTDGASEKKNLSASFKTKYKLGRELGKGQYSTVKEATSLETEKKYAVKCIKDSSLSKEDRDALKVEIDILRKLDHPHIVKFYDFFEERPVYYIVMEYVTGGELFDRIVAKEYYSERDAAKVIKTVCSALKYCHDRGIVHRDLKPENLLLTRNDKGVIEDGNIKVADFGFAKTLPNADLESGLKTSCGTPGYVAPEILKGQVYGKEVDLWSLGVILYILLSGYPPFLEDDKTGTKGLFAKIKSGVYSFTPKEYWKDVSEDGKNLIRQLLKVDPKERLTIEQVLENKWVNMEDKEEESNDITKALKEMKKYQARKKWKMGFNAITAANRISQLTALSKSTNSSPEKVVEKSETKSEESVADETKMTESPSESPKNTSEAVNPT